jgi:rubrerythrin
MKHLKLYEDFINEASRDTEMVDGIVDLLLKVDDIDNRKEMAIETIADFDTEGVEYNKGEFLSKIGLSELELNEARPEFHDSDAPDAYGRFRDLSIKDLAKWLIDTRNGDVKKISSSLTQQIVFNRNDDPEYATKMEKTRKEVYKQLGREDLLEGDAKPGPDKYMTGLDKEDETDKEDQIKKQREMDDDDSSAYKEMPGDEEAREKGQVKTSKHVKKYHELYGDEKNEAVSELQLDEAVKLGCTECDEVNTLTKWQKNGGYCPSCKTSSSAVEEGKVNEEKAEGDRSKLDNADIETALAKKAEETGVPIGLIRIIMRRGMAAWKTGHRPGAGQEQWGYARVNAFLTKGAGTWGDADKDVAKEVRDGGYDKNLKS